MKACIFDLDGTLYQTERIAVPAFEKTFQSLREQGIIETSVPAESKIISVFGQTGKQFWLELLPEADEKIRKEADRMLLKYEKEFIHKGKGKFYPGVIEGLVQLKRQGWTLFIVSNGIREYVNAVLESADLSRLFTAICTLGDQPDLEKKDAVQRLINQYSIKQGYLVGDRESDVEAGIKNGLSVIGCKYKGFPYFGTENELQGANFVVHHFQELLDIIKSYSIQSTNK